MSMSYNCGGVVVNADDVVEIVRKAGDAILAIYNTPTEGWEVQKKGDDSPLTKADLAANKVICDGLKALYPDIPIISEETSLLPYEQRKDYKYFFCVDPLDGTKEFIKRNGQFTVNIGLVAGTTPVLGAVGVPAAEVPCVYYGVVGDGANYENDADRYPERIRCAPFKETDPGLTIVASASHNTPETEAFVAKYDSPTLKSMGSSLKLLLVAQGEAHVYPRMAPTCEWDTCAAHAVVLAAGGEVLQAEGGIACSPGEPLVYNKDHEKLLNPHFVVYGKRVKEEDLQKARASKSSASASSSEGGSATAGYFILGCLGAAMAVGAFLFIQRGS